MEDEKILKALELFKIDLGIMHNKRDTYFVTLLEGVKSEIERKGIVLDLEIADDIIFFCDYAAWQYRKRMENEPMPNNLQYRLRNRIIRKRSGIDG